MAKRVTDIVWEYCFTDGAKFKLLVSLPWRRFTDENIVALAEINFDQQLLLLLVRRKVE